MLLFFLTVRKKGTRMQELFFIKKVAVLGAGVMGAQIAAQCVNAGIETFLYDLAAKESAPDSLVNKAINQLNKLKPSPLATAQTSLLLKARNYEQHLNDLKSCDLIIEAIAERLDWKEALYQKIAPYIAEHAILVSNTSGLSINSLCRVLPLQHHERFCGVHFFNPPRYMHLVELIPAYATSSTLLDFLETWLTRYLGKGIVRAKDTPNFIANRIGVFSLLSIMHHAEVMRLGLDEVDALTGTFIGRPKSATFRTMDVVGLDTMHHVVQTMHEYLKNDPWHSLFSLPSWFNELIQQNHLGQKTGQGIYRKNGKLIEIYDIASRTYRKAQACVDDEVNSILSIKDPMIRMDALIKSSNKQAQFLVACYRDLFHYCAYHLKDIAHTVRDVDLALRWGFGWSQGPFEIWQQSDLKRWVYAINEARENNSALSTVSLPDWLFSLDYFYQEKGAFNPELQEYQPRSQLPVYSRQIMPDALLNEPVYKASVVYENEGVILTHFKEDIAVIQFKTKANSISQSVIDGLQHGIELAERQFQGLVFYQTNAHQFSSGADLRFVAALIKDKKFQALEAMLAQFQQVLMRIKYSRVPTVAALRGSALGGGCELMMHCQTAVAAFESYPGLVELGVGLIPAGGGCKEMVLRAAHQAEYINLPLPLQKYFQQIATAKIASSAIDAELMGYLRPIDKRIMHVNEVLYVALNQIQQMNETNFLPPMPISFKVAGKEGHARLQTGLVNWLEGGFISAHDYCIANELAYVMCGGNVNQGTLVDESWMFQLEREAFMKLAQTDLTLARITHLLETGKPLRN